jgi:uncharacterized spore protein YtfJ
MSNLSLDLANSFKSLGVSTVYGEPVEFEGGSLIPVALTWYGFGAGEGENIEDGDENVAGSGSGGGGGGASIPIGAYVKAADGIRFEPNVVSLLAVGIPAIWVMGKALARIIKALKK